MPYLAVMIACPSVGALAPTPPAPDAPGGQSHDTCFDKEVALMRRILLWLPLTLAAAGLVGMLAARHVTAQRRCETPPRCEQRDRRPGQGTDHPDREEDARLGEAVREILRIRQQQGDLLEGTVLNSLSGSTAKGDGNAGSEAGDAGFAAILRQVAGESRPAQSCNTDARPACTESCRRAARAERSGDVRLVASLRAASRELGRKANELEEQRRFSRADQLRELAARVRREARTLEAAEGGG